MNSMSRYPASKHDYTLITPMMRDACDIVAYEVEKMESGVSFVGTSRFGKSMMLDFATAKLRESHPTVTIARTITTSRTLDADSKFHAHLFKSFGGEDLEGNGDILRTRMEQFFLTLCSAKQDPRLLLVIDEAQRLTSANFSHLIDLTNHLEHHGMAPTVLLVGQPELLDTRDRLLAKRRKDAVGRFLDNPIVFEGISSEVILREVLQQYDDCTKMSFPKGSGISITAAYVQGPFGRGMRLEESSVALWNAFDACARELRSAATVGMRNLTRAVEMGLMEIAYSGHDEKILDEQWWRKVLLDSGYLRHLMTIFEPSPE